MPAIKWFGPTNALVLSSKSGKQTFGDRIRLVDIYRGYLPLCYASQLARGTFGSGSRTGFVVNQSGVDPEGRQIGTLTIEWEAGGSGATLPLPVGNFNLEPQELYPKIERAGVFAGITFRTINICYNAVYLATNSAGTPLVADNFLTANITDATQLALATNLVAKLKRGEETFYLAGWRYTYEQFSYTEPATSRGGIIVSTPGGPLANLPSGVSWLRLADHLEPAGVAGSMYKNTLTFLGGPVFGGVGYWDSDVYV
jgi:hypothetical protein